MNQILKKFKEVLFGTKEWNESVSKVALMLDVIDKSMWEIGDIVKKIPLGNKSGSAFAQFVKEVSEKTKRYKNYASAYSVINEARNLALKIEPEERIEDLPVAHHKVALKYIDDKKERHEKLIEAKEKGLTAEEFKEEVEEDFWEKHDKQPLGLYSGKVEEIQSAFASLGLKLRNFTDEDIHDLKKGQNLKLQRSIAITFKEDIIPFLKKLYGKKGRIIFDIK